MARVLRQGLRVRQARVASRPVEHRSRRDRRQGRLLLTFFPDAVRATPAVRGRVGLFSGKVGDLPEQAAADPSRLRALLRLGRGRRRAQRVHRPRVDPGLSGHLGGVLAGRSHPVSRWPWRALGMPRTPFRRRCGPSTHLIDLGSALRLVHVPERGRRLEDRAAPAAVRRGVRRPGRACPAPGRHRVPTRRCPQGPRGRAARPVRPPASVPAHRRPGRGLGRDPGRPGASSPMHRLLQGEVGSGKTVVALRAMMRVIDSGAQAVLLAPTEVLAQQHHRSITALLGPMAEGGMLGGAEDGTRVALLTGRSAPPPAARRCWRRHREAPASPSAPTPCSRSGSSSRTWAWSWSTSSTGSGSSSGRH